MHGGEKSCIQNLKERDGFEDIGVDGRITVKWVLQKYGRGMCTGFFCLGIGTRSGLLCTR
jgi:hypothetical protein